MPDNLIENLDEKEFLKNLRSPDESPEKTSKEVLAPVHKNVFQHGGTLGTISEKRQFEEEMSSTQTSNYMTPQMKALVDEVSTQRKQEIDTYSSAGSFGAVRPQQNQSASITEFSGHKSSHSLDNLTPETIRQSLLFATSPRSQLKLQANLKQ